MKQSTIVTALAAALAASTTAPAVAEPPRTFVLVIDGMEPENLSRDLTPLLCDLSRCDGQNVTGIGGPGSKTARYPGAQAVITTTTNANHAAMVTGRYADGNGIVANSFFCRGVGSVRSDARELLTAKTLFTLMKEARDANALDPAVTTAMVVGKGKLGRLLGQSTTAPTGCAGTVANSPPDFLIQGTAPTNCKIDPSDPKLEQAVESCLLLGEPATGDERSNDTLVMNEILLLQATRDPKFVFVNLPDVDNIQHVFGVRSPEALATIANVDKQIGRLVTYLQVAGKWSDSILIVTADHSFGDVGDSIPTRNHEDGSADTFSAASPDVRLSNNLSGRAPAIPGLAIGNTRIVMSDLLAGCAPAVGACPAAGAAPDLCIQLYDTGMVGVIATNDTDKGTRLACAAAKGPTRPDCIQGVYKNPSSSLAGLDSVAEFPTDWHLSTARAADLIFAAKDRCALLDTSTSSSNVLSGDHGHLTARHIPFFVAGGPDSLAVDGGTVLAGHQAENVDIAKTVLAIYGVTPPAEMQGEKLCAALDICQ